MVEQGPFIDGIPESRTSFFDVNKNLSKMHYHLALLCLILEQRVSSLPIWWESLGPNVDVFTIEGAVDRKAVPSATTLALLIPNMPPQRYTIEVTLDGGITHTAFVFQVHAPNQNLQLT